MINGKLLVIIAAILAAAATVTSAIAQTANIEREVNLKDRAETWSQTVCLNDLVTDGWIQGRCAVDRQACCRWQLGGEHARTFKKAEIQRELARVNFSGITLTAKGPDQVSVTQTRRELTTDEIKAKIEAAAAAKFGDDAKSVSVTSIRASGPVYVPLDAEAAWDVVLPEQLAEQASIKIISTGEGGQQLGWAQTVFKADADVYVAKHAVHPNDMLKPEDFDLRNANILSAQLAGTAVFRKGQFPEAVRARQTMLPGAVLTGAAIERIPMVRLGDTVTLVLRSDNLRISTKGVVQGSAAIGDMVTVQLQRYNRTFRGRLLEGRLVEVWF